GALKKPYNKPQTSQKFIHLNRGFVYSILIFYVLNRRKVPIGKSFSCLDFRKNSPCSASLTWKCVFTTFHPTMDDNPTAYILRIKKECFCSSRLLLISMSSLSCSCKVHFSPSGPLPYGGGSIIIPLYRLPRFTSRFTNLNASS